MPFCGFNTQPNRCALVSPAISSNLPTLNWILCKGSSVLWERHTLFRVQRVYSGAVVFWIAPGFTSQTGTVEVTFHFLLAMGKRSIPRGAGSLPSLSSAAVPPLIHLSKCAWLQLQSDLTVGVMHTHRAIKPARPTFIITAKWRAECLTSYSSFNLLDDIPLACTMMDFQSFLCLFSNQNISFIGENLTGTIDIGNSLGSNEHVNWFILQVAVSDNSALFKQQCVELREVMKCVRVMWKRRPGLFSTVQLNMLEELLDGWGIFLQLQQLVMVFIT